MAAALVLWASEAVVGAGAFVVTPVVSESWGSRPQRALI